ncbi:MAG: UDP-3-O-acyl-N-acetylglucosamine deacetylase [Planctomycetaceae bacterium]
MPFRHQNTIARSTAVKGVGFLTGADVTLQFHPAGEDHGIVFRRADLPGAPCVPATIKYTVPRARRTSVAGGDAVVEMTEHVLAALYGLQVDNCLVELDAPEPPGCDGSSLWFAEALLESGIVEQSAPRRAFAVNAEAGVCSEDGNSEMSVRPNGRPTLTIDYRLDYGPDSPIPPQTLRLDVAPRSFLKELAFSRTFILESEVEALQAQGYGTRITPKDLLVVGERGIIDNSLRVPNEYVRHKVLDCIGDCALLGCDLHGRFTAFRSGHRLNRAMVRWLWEQAQTARRGPTARAA